MRIEWGRTTWALVPQLFSTPRTSPNEAFLALDFPHLQRRQVGSSPRFHQTFPSPPAFQAGEGEVLGAGTVPEPIRHTQGWSSALHRSAPLHFTLTSSPLPRPSSPKMPSSPSLPACTSLLVAMEAQSPQERHSHLRERGC